MPGGQPTKYDPNFHPEDFVNQSKKGRNLTQIACSWDVHRDSLYEWADKNPEFSDAIKLGRQHCENWYASIGQAAVAGKKIKIDGEMCKPDLGFFVWMTKNICKWSDNIHTKDTTPIDKKVLNVITKSDVKKVLKKIEKKL